MPRTHYGSIRLPPLWTSFIQVFEEGAEGYAPSALMLADF